jgi:hypothetical protein
LAQESAGSVKESTSGEHVLQLFDDAESLATVVAGYLFEGWQRDETLLVVARPQHWAFASRHLLDLGCPIEEVIHSGRLVVLDAVTTLASLMRYGRLARDKFEANVLSVVKTLRDQFNRPLRVYGEMVDVLAAHNDLKSAHELELMWNGVRADGPFSLLCGYSSAHFGDDRTAANLKALCATHDRATAKPTDLLATWLLDDRRRANQARL